jgi:hypothetical protein
MFEFFEIVEVVEADEYPDLVRQHGYVAGQSYEDDGPVEGYGVLLFATERVYSFRPHELKSTGYMLATATDERGHAVPVEASPVDVR